MGATMTNGTAAAAPGEAELRRDDVPAEPLAATA